MNDIYRFNSFTTKSNQALNLAIRLASDLGHNYVGTEHLFLGLLKEGSNSFLFNVNNISFDKYLNVIRQEIGYGEYTKLTPEDFTVRAKKVIETSFQITRSTRHSFVSTEHLLLAILKEEDCYANKMLNKIGINEKQLIDDIIQGLNETHTENDTKTKKNKNKTTSLDEFAVELTERALQGKIDPVIGRENEINRTIQILARRTKNNPCLIGEPGVGKTAIVEGLALNIIHNNVPDVLKNKKIYSLDLTSMVAGTKYRGDFEERLKKVVDEIKSSDDVIVFIDEIHNIIGAGAAEGAVDAANILKPSLSRGDIQIIGATTFSEYKQYIEKDAALERRFQPVTVKEPSEEETLNIILGLKDRYEAHHKVKISNEAIKEAIKLSNRYINDRFLPDKAIDIVDEACSYVKIINDNIVKKSDVEYIVSQTTRIPITQINDDEALKISNLEKDISSMVIGQNEAVKAVSNAIMRSRLGIQNHNRPISSFLFLGSTGVGKSYLCKSLAKVLFGDEKAIIKLDMSEYMEKHSVSKIIGSPPGYVGYDEGGQLTENVRRKPNSIILLDEIEKAHNDIYNLLLQVMEDGVLTDSQGRTVSFKNTIIIMTSNIGAEKITNNMSSLGFTSETDKKSNLEQRVMSDLKKKFKPEFINRIDDIVIFNQLTKVDITTITLKMLDELSKRLAEQEYIVCFSQNVIYKISLDGYDKMYGARPIRRTIQKQLENRLSQWILSGEICKQTEYLVDFIGDRYTLSVK